MNCRKFKPDVFGSVLVCFTVMVVVLASLLTDYWIEGEGNVWNATHLDATNMTSGLKSYFGLFRGSKITTYGRKSTKQLTRVCGSGVCMYSCGTSSDIRKTDLENVLESNMSDIVSTVQADITYCPEQDEKNQKNSIQNSQDPDPSCRYEDFEDTGSLMMRSSMVVTTLLFLMFGLVITIVTTILTTINTCHNPVSAIWGIDGLVVCNATAGFIYFLVMVLWGAEFNIKIKNNLGISNTLRPCGIQWRTSKVHLGYSYWILILCVFLHVGNAVLLGVRQYRRYYSTQAQRARSLKIKVTDDTTATGTVMMF